MERTVSVSLFPAQVLRTRRWLGPGLAAVTLWFATIIPCLADEVDRAVKDFAAGGAAIGVSIGPSAMLTQCR